METLHITSNGEKNTSSPCEVFDSDVKIIVFPLENLSEECHCKSQMHCIAPKCTRITSIFAT